MPLTPEDRLLHVDRELSMHGKCFVAWCRLKRLCLLSQSLSALSKAINQIIGVSGGLFDPQDRVSHQRMYAAIHSGSLLKNVWNVERLELSDVPARWDALRAIGFKQAGFVAHSPTCWGKHAVPTCNSIEGSLRTFGRPNHIQGKRVRVQTRVSV